MVTNVVDSSYKFDPPLVWSRLPSYWALQREILLKKDVEAKGRLKLPFGEVLFRGEIRGRNEECNQ